MDQRVIDFAFKVMMHKKHPDHNDGSAEANRNAQSVNEARRILGNPILRARYDAEFRRQAEAAERSRASYEAELVRRLQEAGRAIVALQSQKERAEKDAQQLRAELLAVREKAQSEVRRIKDEAQVRAEHALKNARAECDAKANELVSIARADVRHHARTNVLLRAELEEIRRAYERLVASTERDHQRIRLFALPIAVTMVLAFVSPGWLADKGAGRVNAQRADKQRVVNQASKAPLPLLPVPIPTPRPIVAASLVRDVAQPVPAPAPRDDAGLPAERLFHPQDKFTVGGVAPQPIRLRGKTVGHLEPNREYRVDEIYQSAPGSSKIYYHVAEGWVHGRLDEFHCSADCQEVWPRTRSARDARAEDEFLLRAKITRLSEADGEALSFGKAKMRARCNIVSNPINVDRRNHDRIVGFFIRNGADTNLLDDAPVLKAGQKVTIKDSYLASGYAHWVYVSTDAIGDTGRRGWVSTSCLAPNIRAD